VASALNDLHAIFNAEHTEIRRAHREVIGEVKEGFCRLFEQSRKKSFLRHYVHFAVERITPVVGYFRRITVEEQIAISPQ
jgi:hypothetical protein